MANGYYLFVAYYKRRWTHLLVSVLPGLTIWVSVPWFISVQEASLQTSGLWDVITLQLPATVY